MSVGTTLIGRIISLLWPLLPASIIRPIQFVSLNGSARKSHPCLITVFRWLLASVGSIGGLLGKGDWPKVSAFALCCCDLWIHSWSSFIKDKLDLLLNRYKQLLLLQPVLQLLSQLLMLLLLQPNKLGLPPPLCMPPRPAYLSGSFQSIHPSLNQSF